MSLLTLLRPQSSTSPTTKAWIRVGGVWKLATPWIKVGGVWKQATPKLKVLGSWK